MKLIYNRLAMVKGKTKKVELDDTGWTEQLIKFIGVSISEAAKKLPLKCLNILPSVDSITSTTCLVPHHGSCEQPDETLRFFSPVCCGTFPRSKFKLH